MTIKEFNFKKTINACKDSVLWNYWDHEHLFIVHDNYTEAKVLYENNELAVLLLKFKLPIFSFLTSNSLNIMYMLDKDTIKVFNRGLFNLLSETTIIVNEIKENQCDIKMNYKFFLDGWKIVLAPFLKKMTESWNQKVWEEDYSLKIRRSKLLNLGFKDFQGMSNKGHKVQKFSLPIKRHIDSPLNLKKNTKNY
jgi:hypothetical protein